VLFAWRLITFQKGRTAVALAAIAFAVIVMFMQLGFYGATVNTALLLGDKIRADLFLVSRSFVHLSEPGTLPRHRLAQALGAPGVVRAAPLYTRLGRWRAVDGGGECFAQVFAFPTSEPVPFRLPDLATLQPLLRAEGAVSVDSVSQPQCPSVASSLKLDNQIVSVAGTHSFGMGFLAGSSIMMSDDSFLRLFPEQSLEQVSVGLLELAPGSDPNQVARSLAALLPADCQVLTVDELQRQQVRHWVENTAVGNIFGLGTAVGFLVGLVVVYQVLSTGVRNQLPQYAVLRAIGSTNWRIYGSVFLQGWLLTFLGFLPGLVAALGIYAGVENATKVPIRMPAGRLVGVLGLALVLSTLSGALCLRKLQRADPADLF
jgi:putative ABC transport system permease protein